MGTIVFPETFVKNFLFVLRNNSEDRSLHVVLQLSDSLKMYLVLNVGIGTANRVAGSEVSGKLTIISTDRLVWVKRRMIGFVSEIKYGTNCCCLIKL